ncbi:MAG: AAA family ATPase [Pseudomonadota bacterium]
MYHEYFGLAYPPFKITPDTALFFDGGRRGEVLDALIYAICNGEGIIKVVGEVGSGKTMLSRMLEVRLPDSVEIVYLANPSVAPGDIMHAIALEMGLDVDPHANRLRVMHALQSALLARHAEGRRVVCFVEEAQAMPMETLEEIRLLSNLETQRDKLLQIVLFGQPELDRNLNNRNIRQLRERIVHSFTLEPFNADDVRDYVHFRMQAAGYRGPDVFQAPAYREIARASEGLVRRINIVADKALLAASCSVITSAI